MTDGNLSKPPIWFWIVAVAALLWNMAGCAAYWMEVTRSPEDVAAMSEAMRDLYSGIPIWAAVGFALGVWCGLLGAIFLLLRKSWAFAFFVLSLIGVLMQNAHTFLLSDTFSVIGQDAMVLPIMVIAICVFLVWFSSHARSRDWIR